MKFIKKTIFCSAILVASFMNAQDWANLEKYSSANKTIDTASAETRVVFMGNSITEGWAGQDPDFFTNNNYIGRGISGQTTPQMLLRFRQDVIDLNPAVVVILAGTNDIAGNTGPMTIEQTAGNIFSMAELALAHDIKVVISSVLPVYRYPWKPEIEPVEKIAQLNILLRNYCALKNIIYLDYFPATADDQQGFAKELADDGVHPTMAGYKVMEPLVKEAIAKALIK
ncbi:SGNH/GDSL hydrolase family protein [Flavimarina sp. Hel_I_48]|uniref:SGNH/GDSL hydrolase family protein n=1 Tax=Flavimarina sp. Hel_I_48 TaxID=1392488 RepID=UPI0004DF268B|nr:SGNH/GDSL hydrolase family protein [Flavimarina sp. Hel_I_48]